MDFNELYWHDSEIRNIEIDRSTPGKKDTILLEIAWKDKGEGTLIFNDVYWARLDLNFGIVAKECIDMAFVSEDNDLDVINLYKRWDNLLKGVDLKGYVIKTISTGSNIKIIAKSFSVVYK